MNEGRPGGRSTWISISGEARITFWILGFRGPDRMLIWRRASMARKLPMEWARIVIWLIEGSLASSLSVCSSAVRENRVLSRS